MTPFEAQTGCPSGEYRRQRKISSPETRLARRKGSIAEAKAIIEKLGTKANPSTPASPLARCIIMSVGLFCHSRQWRAPFV